MRINQETDYAIRIVAFLFRQSAKTDAKTISENLHIPLRFTLKILRRLVIGEAVTSHKGVHGGYIMVKKPDALSFYDIMEIIEGPLYFNRCIEDGYFCSLNGNEKDKCNIHAAMKDINNQFVQNLRSYTFDRVTDAL